MNYWDRLDDYFTRDHKTRWRNSYVTIAFGAAVGMLCDSRGLGMNASCIAVVVAVAVSWAALIARYVTKP